MSASRYFISVFAVVSVCGQVASVPPQIPISISNAASGAAAVAPGSMIVVRSTGAGNYFPDAGRLSLTATQGNTALKMGLLAAPDPYTLWTALPTGMTAGAWTVAVLVDQDTLGTSPITLASASPGLFTTGLFHQGPVVAQNYVSPSSSPVNALTTPALPGQVVTLYGTGLGGAPLSNVTVEVAGIPAAPQYAGPQGSPGLDQINFAVPANAPSGCYIPVDLKVGTVTSNVAALSINATPGACAHPLGLSYANMLALDAGGVVPVAEVYAYSAVSPFPPNQRSDSASLTIDGMDAPTVFSRSGLQAATPSLGCTSVVFSGGLFLLSTGGYASSPLDAGPSATLLGPQGQRVSLNGSAGYYTADLPVPNQASYFSYGTWAVTAPGGPDVGPFQFQFFLPPPIRWTNRAAMAALQQSKDVTFQWDPLGYQTTDLITAELSGNGGYAFCSTYAGLGQVTLPAALLSSINTGTSADLTLSLAPNPSTLTHSTLSTSSGGTIPIYSTYYYHEYLKASVKP